jgi:hypothetical protein
VTAQFVFEIDPRCEGAFAYPIRLAIDQRVQDLQAVVAHADLVDIGKGDAQFAADRAVILVHGVHFSTDVLSRHLNLGEKAFYDVPFEFQGKAPRGRNTVSDLPRILPRYAVI